MNILVTAIGSMSAKCVIQSLKKKHNVFGCDIYPAEWHAESSLCKKTFQVPLAKKNKSYIVSLLSICKENNIDCICPLTDPEIDVINKYRKSFRQILLAIPDKRVLNIVRNKENLYNFFEKDQFVFVPKTRNSTTINKSFFPCIAKPKNGRSSEGVFNLRKIEEAIVLDNVDNYIFQKKIKGRVCTVDYIRSSSQKKDFQIHREELIRTSNGAGLTIRLFDDSKLTTIVKHIGELLNINGCICLEFIKDSSGQYFLIDINPRFSAGIAFSLIAGYDFPSAHINVHCNKMLAEIEIKKKNQLIQKNYQEVTL